MGYICAKELWEYSPNIVFCSLDGKPIMIEKQFLQDIADQNYKKYNISGPAKVYPGLMQYMNSSMSLTYVVTRFFTALNVSIKRQPTFSLPSWDVFGKGTLIVLLCCCFFCCHNFFLSWGLQQKFCNLKQCGT